MKLYTPYIKPNSRLITIKQKKIADQYLTSFKQKYSSTIKITIDNQQDIMLLISKHFNCKIKFVKLKNCRGEYNERTKTISLDLKKINKSYSKKTKQDNLLTNFLTFTHELSHHIQSLSNTFNEKYYNSKFLSTEVKLEQQCESINYLLILKSLLSKENYKLITKTYHPCYFKGKSFLFLKKYYKQQGYDLTDNLNWGKIKK